jgi:hypothetical protein
MKYRPNDNIPQSERSEGSEETEGPEESKESIDFEYTIE